MKSLHERQAELLELKKQAEETESTQQNTSKSANQSQAASTSAASRRGADEDKDEDECENDDESSQVSEEEDGEESDLPLPSGDEAVTPELQALRDKLSQLKNIYNQSLNEQLSDRQRIQVGL